MKTPKLGTVLSKKGGALREVSTQMKKRWKRRGALFWKTLTEREGGRFGGGEAGGGRGNGHPQKCVAAGRN